VYLPRAEFRIAGPKALPAPGLEGGNLLQAKYQTYIRGEKAVYYQAHQYWEMGVVLSGTYRVIDLDGTTDLVRGDAWWYGSWHPHDYSIPAPGTSAMVMEFRPELIFQCSSLMHPLPLSLPFLRPDIPVRLRRHLESKRERILSIARGFKTELQGKTPFWEQAGIAWVELLLVEMLRAFPAGPRAAASHAGWGGIIQAVNYLTQHVSEKIPVAQAAARAGLIPGVFKKEFKRLMGTTCHLFVLRCRLRGLLSELGNGDEKVEVIARKWGFYDISHASRMVWQHMGVRLRRGGNSRGPE
jgi:AraC-like DNA-binding protein